MTTEQEYGRQAMRQIATAVESGSERESDRWESFTDRFIEAIASARLFVDCGAEYGFYTLLALKYGRPDLRVVAFEPEPERFAALGALLSGMHNVRLLPFALSDCSGESVAVKPAAGFSMSMAGLHANGLRVPVQTTTLDAAIGKDRVDVLKMDIEGSEAAALRGATRVLSEKPTLFVEFHAVGSEADREQMYADLSRLYHVEHDVVMHGGRAILRGRTA